MRKPGPAMSIMVLWAVPYFENIKPVNIQENSEAELNGYRKTGTSPAANKNNQACENRAPVPYNLLRDNCKQIEKDAHKVECLDPHKFAPTRLPATARCFVFALVSWKFLTLRNRRHMLVYMCRTTRCRQHTRYNLTNRTQNHMPMYRILYIPPCS